MKTFNLLLTYFLTQLYPVAPDSESPLRGRVLAGVCHDEVVVLYRGGGDGWSRGVTQGGEADAQGPPH